MHAVVFTLRLLIGRRKANDALGPGSQGQSHRTYDACSAFERPDGQRALGWRRSVEGHDRV